MRLLFILSMLLTFNCSLLNAQEIQWANDVNYQYNHFGMEDYSGKQALGPPDAIPSGIINPKAFRLNSESGFGTLIVSYARPQEISQLIVIENHLPGRISEIYLHEPTGGKYKVYENKPQKLNQNYRALILPVNKTSYKVQKVEMHLNTVGQAGWSQIDAVGIANSENPEAIKKSLQELGQVNIQQEVAFTAMKENLGESVNSPYTETKPLISPDGETLYFHRQNHPDNKRGKRDEGDIYYAILQNGEWSMAENIGDPLNDKFANGITSVSPDGNTVLLINEYRKDGTTDSGVSISHKTKKGWSFPQTLNIENLNNKSIYADYFMGNNQKVLLLAIEDENSLGDQDLYVSVAQEGNKWGAPVNLGDIINTSKAEFAPFLASDNKTLYFASEGHGGLGGSDIFYTKRLDDSWQNWSTPKNLGTAINTKMWDAYYAISAAGDYAYFVSTGDGSKDLYRIALQAEFKPEPVVMLSGKVLNARTKEPVEASISFETLPDGKEQGLASSNPENGDYKIVLPQGNKYGYMARAKGYMSVTENIDLMDVKEYREVEKNLYLVPIEVGSKIQMNNLFFVKSKAVMMEASYPELNRLVAFLKGNPSVEIELGGHTDNQGLAKLNYALSKDRVEVVKQYLESKGISGKRIATKAYGGLKPIASNLTEETRAKNRRVEVTILKN